MSLLGGMETPSISSPFVIRDEGEDEVITLDGRDLSNGPGMPMLGMDMVVNRSKISKDAFSRGSGSSQNGSDSDSGSEYSEEDDSYDAPAMGGGSGGFGGFGGGNTVPAAPSGGDPMGARLSAERARVEGEYNEKKEILYQMDRLETKGYKLPRRFSMQSDIEEMRAEYNRIVREKEVDASIRFQRKMMMALVTGIEFLNTRFDPFDIRLSGWSEDVHQNIEDYDDIFEELHEKYKATGKKMAPELRLLMSLSGSAFMFHLTNSMFKQSQLPGVEEVLRSNPELMRQFQTAAAQSAYGGVANASLNSAGGGTRATAPGTGAGNGIFGMFGNLLGLGGAGGSGGSGPRPANAPPPSGLGTGSRGGNNTGAANNTMPQVRMTGPSKDIDEIISNIHAEIRSSPPSNTNRMETMSVSDEEITSIIEDTADINDIMMGIGSAPGGSRGAKAGRGAGGRGRSKARTLNL